MAGQNTKRGSGINRSSYSFRFFPEGTSDFDLQVQGGRGVSVSRASSAGIFTIRVGKKHRRLVKATATVQTAAAADLQPQFGAITNLGSSSNPVLVTLRLLAGATPTDLAADASNSVSVELEFENSTLEA